ncbi:hypothetical protein LCGC14_2195310 [marine sediment metagenome]|uniref:Uncharacterized protein n=1 Tax=marine sediment metagenome TaxID=412755 RepID=A0A0F9DIH2_9ZZZZ
MTDKESFDEVLPVSKVLIESLEKRFPDKAPRGDETERDIWIKTGEVRVVRLLRREFEKLNQTVIGD